MARGDHLYVPRAYGTYTHHGIDCGDGTVIHYKEGEAIARTSLAFFSRGELVSVKPYDYSDPPDQVVERAISRIGERDYHVVFNNCEHFATWCKTGQHTSDQVNASLTAAAVGGALGGIALGGAFAVPAIAAASLYGLHKLVEQAETTPDPIQAKVRLTEAIALIRTQRQDYDQELDRILREAYKWDCTARLALQQGREDLARAALERKYPLKQQALALRDQIEAIAALQIQIESIHPPQRVSAQGGMDLT